MKIFAAIFVLTLCVALLSPQMVLSLAEDLGAEMPQDVIYCAALLSLQMVLSLSKETGVLELQNG